jgi:hypothetical protein
MEIESNLDLSSDHTPVIATISTTIMLVKKIPKLHTAKTNWQVYRNICDDQINLNISLKNPKEIEERMGKLIDILQEAARQATPPPESKKTKKNIPYEIKKLIMEKRQARKKWQHCNRPNMLSLSDLGTATGSLERNNSIRYL